MSVFQTQLPNLGVGALQSREDPNQRASAKVSAPLGRVFPGSLSGISILFIYMPGISFDVSPLDLDCCCSSGHPALISSNRLLQEAGSRLLWPAGGS